MTFRPITDQRVDPSDKVRVYTWEDVEPGDECEPIDVSRYPDSSVHIYYKSGAGTTVDLKGGNDKRGNRAHPDHASAEFETLEDYKAGPISTSTKKIYQKVTNTWWMRPELTGGNGVMDISIHMVRAE